MKDNKKALGETLAWFKDLKENLEVCGYYYTYDFDLDGSHLARILAILESSDKEAESLENNLKAIEELEDYISKYTCEVCGETYLSRTYGHDELYNKFMDAHGINCKNKEV